MKKILLVSKLPPPYFGTTIWTQILLNSDLKKYFRVVHFNNNIHKNFNTLGRPNATSAFQNIVLYFKLVFNVLRENPDLVFIPISQTTAGFVKDSIYVIISLIFRKKALLILHGSNFKNWMDHSSWLLRLYTKFLLKRTQGIVVLGDNLKRLFSDFYPDGKIFVVPNGGNYSFPPKETSNCLRILYLANLIPAKGILSVIESLLYIKKYHDRIVLNIAGVWFDDNFKKSCFEMVVSNNFPIIFHGQVTGEKKYQLFANSDIFVFPPIEPEGLPYVIVEAMAAGLPIISTDQGAIVESVKNEINGFVVDPGKPEQIAQKISWFIENPEKRSVMSRESLRIYKENFTEGKMIERLINVFNEILN